MGSGNAPHGVPVMSSYIYLRSVEVEGNSNSGTSRNETVSSEAEKS